ncbi:MAG TPA: hypothetical protein VMN35_05870 [Gaiellaceae bacterium]|nr:hypothetical protein [Gaiellaceae bacterium]
MILRALFVGLCALVLVTQAAAATMQDDAIGAIRSTTTENARKAKATASLENRLVSTLDAARKHRGTVRFFESRPWLVRSNKHGAWARTSLRRAERRVARTTARAAVLRRQIERRDTRRQAKLPPRAAICDVFGRYCGQAIAVARCESRLDTGARNGQYLGLFQMGSHERRLFGHGRTAHAQSRAAHRYFVRSGRDWSPWSCKPWRWE